jgi:hypothetical protein
MAAFTKKTETSKEFAKGGNTPMFGAQKAGPEAPATTAHDTKGDGGKFASGGAGKMFGYAGSAPAKSGQTGAR